MPDDRFEAEVFVNGESIGTGAIVEFGRPEVDDTLAVPNPAGAGVAVLTFALEPLHEVFMQFAADIRAFGEAIGAAYGFLGGDEGHGLTWSELMAEIDRELEAE